MVFSNKVLVRIGGVAYGKKYLGHLEPSNFLAKVTNMFSKKQTTVKSDGTKITETKKITKITYTNGDFDIIDHRRGTRSNFALTNEDGTRTRDGK